MGKNYSIIYLDDIFRVEMKNPRKFLFSVLFSVLRASVNSVFNKVGIF